MSSFLKKKREECGYTRKQLSDLSGINVRTIEAYEQGLRNTACMELQTALILSDILHFDVRLLCFGK